MPLRSCDKFLYSFKGTPCGRASRGRALSAPGAARGRPAPRVRRGTCLSAAGVAGPRWSRGVAASPRPSGRQPSGHGGRHVSPGPHPAAPGSRRHAAGDRELVGGPVPLAPGILSPGKTRQLSRGTGAKSSWLFPGSRVLRGLYFCRLPALSGT